MRVTDDIELPTFTQKMDGSIVVDSWPEKTYADKGFLEQGVFGTVEVRGDIVDIAVANGRACYRIGEEDERGLVFLTRVYHELEDVN